MTQFRITTAIILTATFLFPMNDASGNKCAQWIKLNKQPVCFGARDNKYGSFTYDRNIFATSFMFVHRSGTVSCTKGQSSYWGCWANSDSLGVILTDDQNKILEPVSLTASSSTFYKLPGYTSSSSILVFCPQKKPRCILRNKELRLWYGEDLRDTSEGDNSGNTCADVFALLD